MGQNGSMTKTNAKLANVTEVWSNVKNSHKHLVVIAQTPNVVLNVLILVYIMKNLKNVFFSMIMIILSLNIIMVRNGSLNAKNVNVWYVI